MGSAAATALLARAASRHTGVQQEVAVLCITPFAGRIVSGSIVVC